MKEKEQFLTKDDLIDGTLDSDLFLLNRNRSKSINSIILTVDSSRIKKIHQPLLDKNFYIIRSRESEGGERVDLSFAYIDNNCTVEFGEDYDQAGINLILRYVDSFDLSIIKELYKFRYKKIYTKTNVSFIIRGKHGLQLIEKAMGSAEVPLENYELSFPYQDIIKSIEKGGAGLVLLSGPPGTGKSWFIRHLIGVVKKDFIYIPTNTAEILSDENFLSFAIGNLQNKILIIEDAETVLADRQKSYNNAASVILNITDGILGDLLNSKIIATINVTENVDSALLRKGRLLSKVDFNKLSVDKCNVILKRLGKTETVSEPHTLSDLYSIGLDNGGEEKKKNGIGFKQK